MNSLAFLIFLGGFGYVLFWYVRNLKKGSDGSGGLLGLKPDADDENPLKKKAGGAYNALPENVRQVKEAADRKAALEKQRKLSRKKSPTENRKTLPGNQDESP